MGDVEPAVSGEQRVVVSGNDPRAENCATDDPGKTTRDDRAPGVKFGLVSWGMQADPNAESQADRSAKTKDVSNEMREAVARVGEHCDGRVLEEEADGAVRKNDPSQECKAKSPDESGAGARASAREESTEGYAKDGAVDQRL